MNLALFDLDHTLIPFDSGMAWVRFLVAQGALPPSACDDYLGYCHQYVAGTLDIHAMHRASVAPLARYPHALLAQWGREFEMQMAAEVPASTRALVAQHQQAGDLCAIVTATTRFVAEPFARLFEVDHLLATEPATADGSATGPLTGEIQGWPCYREHKVTRVQAWLAGLPPPHPRGLQAFERSWFYTDSSSDLPLLEAVTHPVVVRPDARLRDRARREGWPVFDPALAMPP
ncbi:HAD family hydrolase [Ideonella sp. DXS29W]|uniref:HAD family hydrolase n=1 Tax=Ideonella lacteola TaxID=2984193 RepID=A0ABU9BIY5_9BURK